MFEKYTFEELMKEKMKKIDAAFDKREASMIHFALGANAAEAAMMYITLEWMFRQMFGDTAEREYLKKIAYDTRGLVPEEATHAILRGRFNIEVSKGARFSLDALNYYVGEFIEHDDRGYYYQVICETAGEEGNRHFGSMIPIVYIAGLTDCELVEILVPGEDEEDTEVFRKRWRASFNAMAFGGNRADYEEKIKSIDGVGGVKCYRATNASGEKVGGYIKCVVIASDYNKPSDTLIDNIQNIIDPPVNHAEGLGLAPIGHEVTIVPVDVVMINVTATITYESGFSFEDVKSYIEGAVEAYLVELRKLWESNNEGLIVRLSRVEAAILEVHGVLDITDTYLNGNVTNIHLGTNDIPVRGEIVG
ncbi:MAG: baseplate J/gp47 family protein [Lachnospiraceae bacterium]|nr:baseplate J/gp47 family protein [Lachnospiraceae bacterium]